MVETLPDSQCSNGRTDELYFKIADISVSLTSDYPELKLRVARATKAFLVDKADPDLRVRAVWGDLGEQSGGKKIFDSGGLWQLFAENGSYRFRFVSPAFGLLPYKVARFDRDFTFGEVRLHRRYFAPGKAVSPLEYPLDELLLMHLLANGRGAEVHACGIVDRLGNGHLFLGQSGAGKTTMARLWQAEDGVKILSDDRIILRNVGERLWMYGTPWHGEAKLALPARAPLERIYFLSQGRKNELVPQRPAEAISRLLASSFPPFYSPGALDFTLGFFEEVVKSVPCNELRFIPDERVVEYINRTE